MKEQGSLHFLIQAFESAEELPHRGDENDHPEEYNGDVALPSLSLSAPLTRRRPQPTPHTATCQNRECDKPPGYFKKPNSIYCSSRCQSREQNLRQGRVKNVRRNGPASPIQKVTLTRLRAKSISPPSFTVPSAPRLSNFRRPSPTTLSPRRDEPKSDVLTPTDSAAKLRIDFLLS